MTIRSDAAAEAARRAREEAARRAREEAAKKAREAAAKKAKEAAEAAAKAKAKEAAKEKAKAKEADKPKPEQDKRELEGLKKEIKRLEKPAEAEALAEKAKALADRLAKASDAPAELKQDAAAFKDEAEGAHRAVSAITAKRKALEQGKPAERAGATADLLANGGAFQKEIAGLKALKGTPLVKQATESLQRISALAKPQVVASALKDQPDLAKYPAGFAANAAKLRGLKDPTLNQAIDGAARHALETPGALSLENLKANPGLGALVGGSADPALKAKVAEAAKGWAQKSLDRHLEGKEGEDGVKKALEGFKTELAELAKTTGLGDAIGKGAQAAVKGSQEKIEEASKEGGGFFGSLKNAFGDVMDGLGDFTKKLIDVTPLALAGKGLEKVGLGGAVKGLQGVADASIGSFGSLIKLGFGAVGNVADFALDVQGKVGQTVLGGMGKGLDAVGLDGAGKALEKGGEAYAKGLDFVGDQVGNFTKGFGDAIGATVTGLGQMAVHPVQTMQATAYLVTHPGQFKEVGKALWKEGTKHGVAGAVGYVAGNLAPMLLTGGGAAGGLIGTGGRLATAASTASRFGGTMRVAGSALQATGKGLQVGAKGMQIVKDVTGLKFGQAVRTAGTPSSKLLRESSQGANAAFKTQAISVKDGAKAALFDRGARRTMHEAGERRVMSDLSAEQRAARAAANPERRFKTKAERRADDTSNRAEARRAAEAAQQREALGMGAKGPGLKAQIKMLKHKREAFNRSIDAAPNPAEAARLRRLRDADTEKRMGKAYDTLRAKPGYRLPEATVKLAGQTYKALSNPLSFVTRKADKQLERFLRQDIYDALKASNATLTPKRQAIQTTFGLLNAQITQTAPYKEKQEEGNEWLKTAFLPEDKKAVAETEKFADTVSARFDWATQVS